MFVGMQALTGQSSSVSRGEGGLVGGGGGARSQFATRLLERLLPGREKIVTIEVFWGAG